LRQTVTVSGGLQQHFEANGTLTVVPIDVQTGQPSGLPFEAQVGEVQDARSDANGGTVVGTQLQRLLSDVPSATGTMRIDVNVVPGRKPTYQRQVTCG